MFQGPVNKGLILSIQLQNWKISFKGNLFSSGVSLDLPEKQNIPYQVCI